MVLPSPETHQDEPMILKYSNVFQSEQNISKTQEDAITVADYFLPVFKDRSVLAEVPERTVNH